MPKENAFIKTISQLVEAEKYEEARQVYLEDLNKNGKQANNVLKTLFEQCNNG